MSFDIQKHQFGDLTEYVVEDSQTGNRFVVVPELGGIVRQLSLRKGLTLFSVLKTPETPDSLKADTQSASELLFPFASRIPGGTYHFLGKTYQFKSNDPNHNSAIHGLVRKQPFHLLEQGVHHDKAFIILHHRLESRDGYPFEIDFKVTYTLTSAGVFELQYEASNLGTEPAPSMFGWHPYFRLGNEDADAWKINIPSDTIVDLNADMIPTGRSSYPITGPTKLFQKSFDSCFVVNGGGTVLTELISDNQDVKLQIRQETGEGLFNFLVVYTPPSRDCVAIEPLTGNVNAFNNGEGLNIIPQGGSISGKINVQLS